METSSSRTTRGRLDVGAGEREHLLLAAAHRPGGLGQALAEPREGRGRALPTASALRPAPGQAAGCPARSATEDAAALGDVAQPRFGELVRRLRR